MSTNIIAKIPAIVVMLAAAGMLIWRLKKAKKFYKSANSGNFSIVMVPVWLGIAAIISVIAGTFYYGRSSPQLDSFFVLILKLSFIAVFIAIWAKILISACGKKTDNDDEPEQDGR